MKWFLERPNARLWLAIVGSATLVLIAAYSMVQQSTRLGANDAPTVEAQIIAQALNDGTTPADAITGKSVDLGSGALSVFAIITDESYHVTASSVSLNNKTPLPPSGVFQYTKAHGSDNITWQPDSKVRLATHVAIYRTSQGSGYIITGQSLHLYEDRVNVFSALALLAWLGVAAWTTFVLLLPSMVRGTRPVPKNRR